MKDLLSHWDEHTPLPPFVNPFAKGSPRAPESLIVARPICFGPVLDLEKFLAKCRKVVDWEQGYFPPPGFTDSEFDGQGLTQFIIQPWYSDFYYWASHQDGGAREHIILGTPGIGESVFGLYFMARLVASNLSKFCGHPYFDFSWKPRAMESARFAVRITLKGKVISISPDELAQDATGRVFRLLDGWCCECGELDRPVLAILSPSRIVTWKNSVSILYAPSLRIEACRLLSGISTRYGFDDGDPENPDFPVSLYGNITSRMKIVGGNLRLIFGVSTLQDLMDFMREGLSSLDVSHFRAPLDNYFTDPKKGGMDIHCHRLFACYSFSPFNQVHEISYVSPWVESEVN
jgi:hypothetical protein